MSYHDQGVLEYLERQSVINIKQYKFYLYENAEIESIWFLMSASFD